MLVHFLFLISQFFLLALAADNSPGNETSPIFTAVSSKVIYPNSLYNISVFVEPNGAKSEALKISAKITGTKENFKSEEKSVLPGKLVVLPIKLDELTGKNYNLTVTVTDPAGNITERTTGIFSSQRDKSILIQTDKAIYKPGEIVKFRVVLLNRHLKPLREEEPIDVKIYDGQRNLIKNLEDVKVEKGFYKDQLQLSSEPILGDWNIEVRFRNQKDIEETSGVGIRGRRPFRRPDENPASKTLSFSVEQYVLPKYEVTVKLPNFITFEDFKVPVQVGAKYTYGKAVAGECTLNVKRFYSYDTTDGQVRRTLAINGTAMTEVNIEPVFKAKASHSSYRYEQDIIFEASCTEEITGKVLNASSNVRIYNHPYNIERVKHTESLKPGLPYTAVFKISTPDNKPISDPAPDALKITHGFSYELEGSSFTAPIPENGLVRLTFRTPTNILNQPKSIEVKYKQLSKTFYNPSFYSSDAKTYMQIQLVSEKNLTEVNEPAQEVGKKMTINVNATKPFETLNYLIHGRQDILASDQINLPSPVMEYNLEIVCPEKADPEARIVIYTVLSETKDLLVDSLKFSAKKVDKDNYLNITLSEDTREPGENVTLTLNSAPGSLIALRGVDQSVLLLKEDKDINQKSLDDEVVARENEAIWSNRNWGGSDAFRLFEDGGLAILTNAKLKTPDSVNFGAPESAVANQEISSDRVVGSTPLVGFASPQGLGGGAGGSAPLRVRTEFPESWLWEDLTLNSSNTIDLTKIVPDTLTSWVISGYSLNPELGVGIAEPVKLTTFRPFFISLNLPYSVVKGEVLLLQVLVHNYLPGDKEVSAEIILDNSEGKFQFADEKIKDSKQQTKSATLTANGVSSVKFAIIPQNFGLTMLKVKGVTGTAGDALSQPLRVIPPGQRQKRSTAVLLNPGKTDGLNMAELNATFPEKRVEGADQVQLTLISDILGPTLNNVGKLLELPTGCGEQNMMAFVSNIVILNYLNATDSLNKDLKTKAIEYLESGYQRELTYKHFDGSFSSFGSNDVSGSTWLTAFVAKSLIEAKPYITVDDTVIEKALAYLERQQTSDGGFYENAPAFQRALRGSRTTGGVALTAYVALAFLEAQKNWSTEKVEAGPDGEQILQRSTVNRTIIDRALNFITEKASKDDFDDVYALVLSTYAATVADHPSKDKLFSKLDSSAKTDKGYTFWEVPKKNLTKDSNETETDPRIYFPWGYYIQPVSVEMTSYSLLTYILRGKAPDALPLVRWLLNQRNSNGGFISTQDTVLGLTALAKYAELTHSKETDLQVKFKQGSAEKSVPVNEKNAQVVQEFELPAETRSLDVAASGKGSVLGQLTWTYYVEDEIREPSFGVNVTASNAGGDDLSLQVCTNYLGKDDKSDMAIAEVNLPSGYVFDTETLKDLKSAENYKRHDLQNQNTKLEVYFNSLSFKNTCFPLTANRVYKVGKQSPSYVSVYDYYDTTKRGRAFYEAPSTSICDICVESNDCAANNCI